MVYKNSMKLPLIPFFIGLTFLWVTASGLLLTGCKKNVSVDWEMIGKDLRSKFPTVKQITTAELQKWLNSQDPARPLLIDRREPGEYAVSHLSGAFLATGEEDALKIIEKEGKDRPVVIYCSVGYRSSVLAKKLGEKGFTNIYNLEGSIFKWANEGRPIYRGDRRAYVVHPFSSKWKKFLDRKFWYFPGKQE